MSKQNTPCPVSVIMPAFNEAEWIDAALERLQPLREAGSEVIVVDGGSSDATVEKASFLADRVIRSAAGRAAQMGAGADVARGRLLWFLHADTLASEAALQRLLALAEQLDDTPLWGRFDARLSGRHWVFRVVERLMNWRSRASGIATGDQGIFVSRALYDTLGGFDPIPLMEDVAFCRKARRQARPLCCREPITTSSRRWEERGVTPTILLMWYLRFAYFVGASPHKLAARYYPRQSHGQG